MKLSRKVMQPRMFFLVSNSKSSFSHSFFREETQMLLLFCLFSQFNDALMYTTPVQSGQYKLNSVLSLAGMKVRNGTQTVFIFFVEMDQSELNVFQVSKPSQEAYQNELNIESVERSFILSARLAPTGLQLLNVGSGSDALTCVCVRSSAKERDEWLEAIGRAIEDYTKKKITFISSRSQEEVRLLSLCAVRRGFVFITGVVFVRSGRGSC